MKELLGILIFGLASAASFTLYVRWRKRIDWRNQYGMHYLNYGEFMYGRGSALLPISAVFATFAGLQVVFLLDLRSTTALKIFVLAAIFGNVAWLIKEIIKPSRQYELTPLEQLEKRFRK